MDQMIIRQFLTRLFCTLLLIISAYGSFAQIIGARTVAGPHGIWVICGNQLPKNLTYHLERKKAGQSAWMALTDVNFPSSREDIQATLLNTERVASISIAPPEQARLEEIWKRITLDVIKNSPPEMENMLPMRCATGTAWYDGTADSVTVYEYKVRLISAGKTIAETVIKSDSYPGKRFNTQIKPIFVKPMRAGIYAEFEIVDKGQMTGCKIFRSYYLRSGYTEIDALPIYNTRNGKLIVSFTDNTAMDKVPYSYVLLPFDAAGNPGHFSPELRAFAVPNNSIVPSVHLFSANSHESDKTIRLSWQLQNPVNIISIDIFRSTVRDSIYTKIASVNQHDTVYYDHDVEPIVTYWYTIRLNGVYETSPASPRTPGILGAVNKNIFPPQNLTLRQNGNKVTLYWQRVEKDTRAYLVYRASGKSGKLQHIGPVIVTDSTRISYTDTLPASAKPSDYTYAVADENTSYAISPMSALVFAHIAGNAQRPIPYNIAVTKLVDNKVIVIWPDMIKQDKSIRGYLVYRRVQKHGSASGDTVLISKKIIPFTANHFTDTISDKPGVYYYSVRTLADDGKTLSSPSLEAGYTVQDNLPNPVSNIQVFASGSSVELRWNNPIGQLFKLIKIYRAIQGSAYTELASLQADKEAYSDKTVTTGTIYYYYVQVQDGKGKKSNNTTPIGIHVH